MLNETVYDSPRKDLVPFVPSGISAALDVGCAAGGFGRTIRAQRPGLRLWGIEPDPRSADAARASGYEEVVTGFFPEAAARLSHHSYDAIFMMDVLEHMPNPASALLAAAYLLAVCGTVVASIPNARHVSVWWPLARHGQWTYTDTGLMDRTHIRWFTAATIRTIFAESGYDVVLLKGTNRTRRPPHGDDGWKLRLPSRIIGKRSDAFLWVQYVVHAQLRRT